MISAKMRAYSPKRNHRLPHVQRTWATQPKDMGHPGGFIRYQDSWPRLRFSFWRRMLAACRIAASGLDSSRGFYANGEP